MFPDIEQLIWVRKYILFTESIVSEIIFWIFLRKLHFPSFEGPNLAKNAGFSSIYATITIVGYRYGDSRVIKIQRYLDLSNIFRLKNPKILTFRVPTWYFLSKYLESMINLVSPYLQPTIVILSYIDEKHVFWPNLAPRKWKNGVFSKRSKK